MSENRDIEQRLRDYGKKRRGESADSPELHPATRRLLQGEVSRVYGAGRAVTPASSGAVHRNWTRFGLAFALFLGLGVAAVLLLKVETPIGNETRMVRVVDELATPAMDQPVAELPMAPQTAPSPVELRPEAAPSPAAASGSALPALRESQVALQDAEAILADRAKREAKAAMDKDSSDGFRRLGDVKQKVEAQPSLAGSVLQPGTPLSRKEQPTDAVQLSAESRVSAATAPVMVPNMSQPQNRPVPAIPPPPSAPAAVVARVEPIAAKGATSTTTTTSTFYSTAEASKAALAADPSIVTGIPLHADGGAIGPAWEMGAAFDGQFTKTSAQPGSAGQDRSGSRGGGAAAAEDILSGFQFSYVGGEVKITDHDGSVYVGRASPTTIEIDEAVPAQVPTPTPTPTPTGRISTVRRSVRDIGGPARHLAFEVVGTNRTLNQRVSFNGVLAQTELQKSDVAKRLQASKSTLELETVPSASQTNPVRSRAAAPPTRTDAPSTSTAGVVRGFALGGASAASPARTNSVMQIQGRVKVGTQPELPLRWAGESVNR